VPVMRSKRWPCADLRFCSPSYWLKSLGMSGQSMEAVTPVTLDPCQERSHALYRSGSNAALLGRAGCGKSEVMRRMVSASRLTWGSERVAVVALSGAAALVIGGQTLHSLFGMDTRPLSKEGWLRETLLGPNVVCRLNALRVMFIDEVCTLPSSLFTRVAFVMRRVAPPHLQHLPFAGCQLVGKSVSLYLMLCASLCVFPSPLIAPASLGHHICLYTTADVDYKVFSSCVCDACMSSFTLLSRWGPASCRSRQGHRHVG